MHEWSPYGLHIEPSPHPTPSGLALETVIEQPFIGEPGAVSPTTLPITGRSALEHVPDTIARETQTAASSAPEPPGTLDLHFLDNTTRPPNAIAHETKYNLHEGWPMNDSGFDMYCKRAERSKIPEVRQRIMGQLCMMPYSVGLDVAGGTNGVAIQELLHSGLIDRGIFTNYLGRRDQTARNNPDIHCVEGDLLAKATWRTLHATVRATAPPEGLSIITFFPGAALEDAPHPVYHGGLHALLDMLRPGGVFLGSIPITLQRSGELPTVHRSLLRRGDIASIETGAGHFNSNVFIIKT